MQKIKELRVRISNSLWRARKKLHDTVEWVRFGDITEKVVGYAGDHVVAEIEYRGRGGKLVGYWALGSFDPSFPYQGGIRPRKASRTETTIDLLNEDLA